MPIVVETPAQQCAQWMETCQWLYRRFKRYGSAEDLVEARYCLEAAKHRYQWVLEDRVGVAGATGKDRTAIAAETLEAA